MRKNLAILILALSLFISMVGCGQKPEDPTITTDPTNSTQPFEEGSWPTYPSDEPLSVMPTLTEYDKEIEKELIISCQYLPQTVDNPENLPVLKWVCLVDGVRGGTSRIWNEAAVHELNQMLADRDMPFRVQFVMMSMSEWLVDPNWFSRPEVQAVLKDADLIYGIMSADEKLQYLSPITEYATGTAEPSLKSAVAHELDWSAAMINGEIYGIPTIPYAPRSIGWKVDPAFLSDYGLNEESFSCNYWEMDELFAEIYEKNGNKPFLAVESDDIIITFSTLYDRIQIAQQTVLYRSMPRVLQTIGSCFAIDHSGDTPAIVNILETDTARLIQQATARYRAAGYVVGLSSELGMVTCSVVNGQTTYTLEDGTICIPVEESVFVAEASGNYISGIAATSQYKTEAISLLRLIGEDEAFRMQLLFGKEGRDYILEDGYYSLVKQEDGSYHSISMVSPLSYFAGLTAKEAPYLLTPGVDPDWMVTYDGKTTLQTYVEMMDTCDISYYPIAFDYSEFEQELAAVDDVFRKYYLIYTNPKYMTEELYSMMLAELHEAGAGEIQAELQRQLEEYLAKDPA